MKEEKLGRKMNFSWKVYHPRGEGKKLAPMILLHGLLDSMNTWFVVGPQIADRTGREVYIFDIRNHGDAVWSDKMGMDALVKDLEEFMDRRGIQTAVLVGHNLGAAVAEGLAFKRPERVEKLVFEDYAPGGLAEEGLNFLDFSLQIMGQILEAVPKGLDENTVKKYIAFSALNIVPKNALPVKRRKATLFELIQVKILDDGSYAWKLNMDSIAKNARTLLSPPKNGQYTGDVLVIYGCTAIIRPPKTEQELAEARKYCPNVQVTGAKKWCIFFHYEHPEEFTEKVVSFINRGPPSVQSKL